MQTHQMEYRHCRRIGAKSTPNFTTFLHRSKLESKTCFANLHKQKRFVFKLFIADLVCY